MLVNFFKIALRNLRKQAGYSLTNILGLAVGLASCLLIWMYVYAEMSYDKYHPNKENIYRLGLNRIYPNRVTSYAITPHSYGEAAVNDIPEVIANTAVFPFRGSQTVVYAPEEGTQVRSFEEEHMMLADSNFFDVFEAFTLIEGDPDQALQEPNSVVITKSTAQRYFGEGSAVGKVLRAFNQEITVTGVCEDIPDNTHFQFDILASAASFPFLQQVNFTGFSVMQYLVLQPGTDPAVVEAKLPDLVTEYAGAEIQQNLAISYEEYVANGNGYEYFLQALPDIYLTSHLEGEMRENGNQNTLYQFLGISLFVLVLAIINFMNLATARSAKRAKEVGVRKTLGSSRGRLVGQFLTEAIMIALIAFSLALFLVAIVLPWFNQLSGQTLTLQSNYQWLLPLGIGLALLVGLLSGSYPAFVLSSYRPAAVLKGKMETGLKGVALRNGLVVFQFFVSILLITSTLIIYQQTQYMRNKSLGFEKQQVFAINRPFMLQDAMDSYISEVKRTPGVTSAALASTTPGRNEFFFGAMFQKEGDTEAITTKNLVGDDFLMESLGLELIKGRFFQEGFNDSLSLVLNEAALEVFGFADPIGQQVELINGGGQPNTHLTIVGVVKDFHFQSLHSEITPLTISYSNQPNQALVVRTANGDYREVLGQLEAKWDALVENTPFSYYFLDEDLDALYANEQRAGQILTVFTGMAILIACIGLLGLASYTAQQRRKEIGVRKVLGASSLQIIFMLSGRFTLLVAVSLVLSIPVAWYFMDRWLEGFAYRIQINPVVFIAAGLTAIVIAWLTVSYQSWRAAVVNPVRSLKED